MSPDIRSKSKSQVSELLELLISYLKQETIGPISRLGRYILFGMAGSILVSFGIVLLVVGLLRLLQDETGSTFTGDLSWLPYVISALAGIATAGIAVMGVVKKRDTRTL